MARKPSIVIALGGNAISKPGKHAGLTDQFYAANESMQHVAELVVNGYEKILITHGNGPQVGAAMLRSEIAEKVVYPHTLDIADAETQGSMGYMLQQVLYNCLRERGIKKPVATIVTQVVVDVNDPAFERPCKPVGRFYNEGEAKELMAGRGWDMQDDAGRGWRRFVPSPRPIHVLEIETIRDLFDKGYIVIAGGGGGIPVGLNRHNKYYGLEAVIDKDRTSAVLAHSVEANTLLVMTAVEYAFLGFRTPDQRALTKVSAAEMQKYLEADEFAVGSMKPKVEACLSFLENGGSEAIITSIPNALLALRGKTGTHIKK
jgi:carbamate kinase